MYHDEAEDSHIPPTPSARQRHANRSTEELIDLALEIILELKDRLAMTRDAPLGSFLPVPVSFRSVSGTDVEKFLRLPDTPINEGAAATWRLILISPNPEDDLLGLEVHDDVIVGRTAGGATPDLDLTDYGAEEMGVSRRHALLHPTRDSLLLHDLGSSNGTYCNGALVSSDTPQKVSDTDIISFARLSFKVKIVSLPGRRAP